MGAVEHRADGRRGVGPERARRQSGRVHDITRAMFAVAVVANIQAAMADDRLAVPRIAADRACWEAVKQIVTNSNSNLVIPSQPMTSVLIERCNENPDKAFCELASQAMIREYGKTPFNCGAATDGSEPLMLPGDKSP